MTTPRVLPWKLQQLAALSGLGFAATALAGRLAAPVPVLPEVESGGLVRSYYLDYRTALQIRGVLWGVGCVLAVAFLAALATQLRRAPGLRWLSAAALVAGAAALTLWLSAGAALGALVEFRQDEVLGATGGDSGGAVALFELYSALDRLAGFPAAGLLGATSLAVLVGGAETMAGRAWPRWFGLAGLAAGVLLLAAAVGVPRLGGVAQAALLVWVAAASLLLSGTRAGRGRPSGRTAA